MDLDQVQSEVVNAGDEPDEGGLIRQ